jgi:hypothetical protein
MNVICFLLTAHSEMHRLKFPINQTLKKEVLHMSSDHLPDWYPQGLEFTSESADKSSRSL